MGSKQRVLFAIVLIAPMIVLAEVSSPAPGSQSPGAKFIKAVEMQSVKFARQRQARLFHVALEKGDIREASRLMKENQLSANEADYLNLLESKTGFLGAKFVVENGLDETTIREGAKQAALNCRAGALFRALLLARQSGAVVDEIASDTLRHVKAKPLSKLRCGLTQSLLEGGYDKLSEDQLSKLARSDDERFMYERQQLSRQLRSESPSAD